MILWKLCVISWSSASALFRKAGDRRSAFWMKSKEDEWNQKDSAGEQKTLLEEKDGKDRAGIGTRSGGQEPNMTLVLPTERVHVHYAKQKPQRPEPMCLL